MGKNPQNFKLKRQESFENEQKHVKIDDFNSDEEKKVKEQEEQRKRKRCASWKKQGTEKEKRSWERKSKRSWTLEAVEKRER